MGKMSCDLGKRKIEIQFDAKGPASKSGKSELLFTTHGGKAYGDVVVSVNVYRRAA